MQDLRPQGQTLFNFFVFSVQEVITTHIITEGDCVAIPKRTILPSNHFILYLAHFQEEAH